ncbi:MAG: 50S ribosomal protein L13 [Candidatus Pacebacteria bacterium]|nr:50S ribosomal protein L13 [Candidatus Paceibacterota bacterium]
MKNTDKKEIILDATNKSYGRLASLVAILLQGKDSPNFAPNVLSNNVVIITNIEKLKFTGNKEKDKKYYRHSGYIGNLKEMTLEEKFSKNPEKFFKDTVKGMLPRNKLNSLRLKQLIIK